MSGLLLVGTRKGLFIYRRESAGWKTGAPSFLGDPVTAVLHDERDDSIHAGLNLGHFGVKMHRSEGLGETWNERTVPAFPEKPADWEERDDKPGTKAPWSIGEIWALEHGGSDRPGVLWCGTIPGGLFRSEDFGETWELQRSLWDRPERLEWMGGGADDAAIHSICVHPENSDHVTLGVSIGGIWITRDGGKSWVLEGRGMEADYMPPERREHPGVQDPHRLVQCRAAPNHLWVQHHNGIFRSADGGAEWQRIQEAGPSTFGFAVAVHPEDPDTAWFVPGVKDECRVPVDGRFVVTRTRDGGKTFDVLDQGLPGLPSDDIVFRHALDVDDTGDVLAMGSTTGGSGSRKMAATIGRRCQSTCRRCTACGSRSNCELYSPLLWQLEADHLRAVPQKQFPVGDHGMIPRLPGEHFELRDFAVLLRSGLEKNKLPLLAEDNQHAGIDDQEHLSVPVAPTLPATLPGLEVDAREDARVEAVRVAIVFEEIVEVRLQTA